MAEDQQIWVVTASPSSSEVVEGEKAATGINQWHPENLAQKATEGVKVSAATLQKNMSKFLGLVGNLFQQAEGKTGMKLDEVELSVEITADGEVKLVGSGVGVEAKGAITLKFKRDE